MADDEITLEQAVKLARDGLVHIDELREAFGEDERPANRPGAEAGAVLEAMLAAGRAGKVVKGG